MSKRILNAASFIIVICIVFSAILAPSTAFADTFGDFVYSTGADGNVCIDKYVGGAYQVSVPEVIDGRWVTSIGASAFNGAAVFAVQLPETVTEIGDFAFQDCGWLAEISFPPYLQRIGAAAFENTHLSEVTIPSEVRVIEEGAFAGSTITRVTIKEGVETIGDGAFVGCKFLTEAILPSSIYFVDYPFYGCDKLTIVAPHGSPVHDYANRAGIAYVVADDPWTSYFPVSPSIYDNRLAQASLDLCEAANNVTATAIERKFDEQGFTSISSVNYGDEWYLSFAYSFAAKNIIVNGEATKLIAVVCRGTTTAVDVAADVTLGLYNTNIIESNAQSVYDNLQTYVSSASGDGANIRFLVTGHSAGGAVASIVGASLAQDGRDTFTYTFASPNTQLPLEKQIFKAGFGASVINLVNEEDNVTAWPQLGSRLGKDYLFRLFKESVLPYIDDVGIHWSFILSKNHYVSTYREALESGMIKDDTSALEKWSPYARFQSGDFPHDIPQVFYSEIIDSGQDSAYPYSSVKWYVNNNDGDVTFGGMSTKSDNGYVERCYFSGEFHDIKKLSDYIYSMHVKYIESDPVGFVPFGFENADEFLLFMPGMNQAILPLGFFEEFSQHYINSFENTNHLPVFCAYNVNAKHGFVGGEDDGMGDDPWVYKPTLDKTI